VLNFHIIGRIPTLTPTDARPRKKNVLASNQTAIYLLIALAAGSLAGTIIPQEYVSIQPAELSHLLADSDLARIADALGLFHVFSTWWYRLLIALLVVNLILCSLDGLNRLIAVRRSQKERKGRAVAEGMKTFARVSLPAAEAKAAARAWTHAIGTPLDRGAGDADVLFAERFAWARYGPYLIHSSLLLVVAGALIGQVAGIAGSMNILEGTGEDTVRLDRAPEGRDGVQLPFTVRCDRFEVEFYPGSRRPKEFTSDLVIVDGGREAAKKTIQVNDPLAYKGYRFFQASYGQAGGKTRLRATPAAGGEPVEFWVVDDQVARVPGSTLHVRVINYAEDHMNAGPAVQVAIEGEGGRAETAWLFQHAPDFDATRKGEFILAFLDRAATNYTGLSVQKDPGVPVVWSGFAAMFLGLAVTYGFTHRRAAAVISAGTLTLAASGQGRREPLVRGQRAILQRLGVKEN
jgi:cytochrome c biogenesis protein